MIATKLTLCLCPFTRSEEIFQHLYITSCLTFTVNVKVFININQNPVWVQLFKLYLLLTLLSCPRPTTRLTLHLYLI